MSSRMKAVLLVGGTSGIGEGFARRFHALGKEVTISGRRADRLYALAKELPGLKTVQWDITDFDNLSDRASAILATSPQIDTIFINAGMQKLHSFLDSSSNPQDIRAEIDTNLTAPLLLARLFLSHLQSVASAGKSANLFITGSTIGFLPMGFYPVYCPTKAAIHAFCVALRQQLAHVPDEAVQRNLNIVEVVPPYVDTGLDQEHRETIIQMQGGPEKAFKPMPLDEYMQQAFKALEAVDEGGRIQKEIGVGLGQVCVDLWREGFGKTLSSMGIDA